MARLVKCPYCENQLSKDEAYEYKKKYYHVKCFETWQNEKEDRKNLIDYICKIYRLDAPTGMILKQIKDFQENYKYRLKGMELALRYFHDTLGNRPLEGQGIGIIPFIYEDAKNDYMKQMKIAESLQNLDKKEEITVYIDPNKNKRRSKKIDIAAI